MSYVPIPPPSLDPSNVKYKITGTNAWSQSTAAILAGFKATSVSQSANGQYILVTSTFGVISGAISISSDFGATWTQITNDNTLYFYGGTSLSNGGLWTASAVSSTGAFMTICSSDGYVYYTDAYGGLWYQTINPLSYTGSPLPVSFTSIAISSNGQYVYACSKNVPSGAPGRVYVSSQFLVGPAQVPTSTTTVLGSLPDNTDWTSISCSSSAQGAYVCSSSGLVYATNRYGTSWYNQVTNTTLPTGIPWSSVAYSSVITILCASNGDVYIRNGGPQWTQSTSFTPPITAASWNSISISTTGQYLVLSNSSTSNATNPVYVSSDQGITWTQIPFPNNPTSVAGVSISSSGQYMVTAGTISSVSNVFTVSVNEDIGNIYGSQIALLEASQPLGNGLANTLGTNVCLGRNIYIEGNGYYNGSNALNNDMYFKVLNTSDGNSGTFYFENGGYATGPTLNLVNTPGGYGSITGVQDITFGADADAGQIGNSPGQFTIQTDDIMQFVLNNNAQGFFFKNGVTEQDSTGRIYCGPITSDGSFTTNGGDISTEKGTAYGRIDCGPIDTHSGSITCGTIYANSGNLNNVSNIIFGAGAAAGEIGVDPGQFTIQTDDTMQFVLNNGTVGFLFKNTLADANNTGRIYCGPITSSGSLTTNGGDISTEKGTAYGRIDCGPIDTHSGDLSASNIFTSTIRFNNSAAGYIFGGPNGNSMQYVTGSNHIFSNISDPGPATNPTPSGNIYCKNINAADGLFIDNASIEIYKSGTQAVIQVPPNGLIPDSQPGVPLYLSNQGRISASSSSARYKDDIVSLPDDRYNLETFMKLKPVQFVYKENRTYKNIGFIAEELDELKLNEIVFYKENVPETLDYTRISVFLTKIVQEQQTKIDDLTSKLQAHQSQIVDLTSKLQALTDLVNSKLV